MQQLEHGIYDWCFLKTYRVLDEEATHIVQIDVNPPIVSKNEVFENIYLLHWIWVSIVDGYE